METPSRRDKWNPISWLMGWEEKPAQSSMGGPGAKVLRPLGGYESSHAAKHALGYYRCVANTCRYYATAPRLDAKPLRLLMENAIAQLVAKLPNLRIGIAGQDGTHPAFVALDSVRIEDVLEWKTVKAASDAEYTSRLLGIIENQHDQLWPDVDRRPLWKAVVIQPDIGQAKGQQDGVTFDVLFAIHHSVGDGTSTSIFHKHLLQELSQGPPSLSNPLPKDKILRFSDLPEIAPAQDTLIKFDISYGYLFRTLWEERSPCWICPGKPDAAPVWTGKPIVREPHRLHMRLVTLPAGLIPRLLSACRVHGATLTTLLHALTTASLCWRLTPEAAPAFAAGTPIGLRAYTQGSGAATEAVDLADVMGAFVTVHIAPIGGEVLAGLRRGWRRSREMGGDAESTSLGGEDADEPVWRLAASLRASTKRRLDKIPKDDIMGLLSWVSNWHRQLLGKVGAARDTTWELSNIGSMAGRVAPPPVTGADATLTGDKGGTAVGSPSSWEIQRSIFSQSANVAGPAFSLNVSGVDGGEVAVSLTWQEDVVEQDIMDGLRQDLELWLGRFDTSGRLGVFDF